MKIFAYYADLQQYLLLDRRLGVESNILLTEDLNGNYINIATQALDGQVWGVEQGTYQLIKYKSLKSINIS